MRDREEYRDSPRSGMRAIEPSFKESMFGFFGIHVIGDKDVGIPTRRLFGRRLPEGQIVARDNEVGIQARITPPGWNFLMPFLWKMSKTGVVVIDDEYVGIVEAIDGAPLSPGRLLGDTVDCSNFQNVLAFLQNEGKKGPQVGILLPGEHRIHLKQFKVSLHKRVEVGRKQIGVVVARDGRPLPTEFIIAPRPMVEKDEEFKDARSHNFFQDAQAFLDSGGYRGPQLDTLQPGYYYINPLMFDVTTHPVLEVPPGSVAVVISNVGRKLKEGKIKPPPVPENSDFEQPLHEETEALLVTEREERGIWEETLPPGYHNVNPLAYTHRIVPTSAITVDWSRQADATLAAAAEEQKLADFYKQFDRLDVVTKDAFELGMDLRIVMRIPASRAPSVIARFGTVTQLIEEVAFPVIDSSFRVEASRHRAIEFITQRDTLREQALTEAQKEFKRYGVEVQDLLISYIEIPQNLRDTQTNRSLATHLREQYEEEEKAENQRINVQDQRARADQRPEVVRAELAIKIAEDSAEARRKEAGGDRDATKARADGESYKEKEVGFAIADAYERQAKVLGRDSIAAIKAVTEMMDGGKAIVPEVLVTGDNQGGNIMAALFANMLNGKNGRNGSDGEDVMSFSQMGADQPEEEEEAVAGRS